MSKTFPPEALSQHVAIVGTTGAGKTFTAKGAVESLLDAQKRVCIIDPTGAWWGLRLLADGKRKGYGVAIIGGDHGDMPINEHMGEKLAQMIGTRNMPAVLDLSDMLIGERHRFMTDFAEALFRHNKQPLHLIIDEADEFCPQNPLPETRRMLHHIDRIVRRGRIRGFRVMMITQRPATISKNVLTQANTLVALRLTSPQDRKAITEWVKGNADENEAKSVLDSLARLKRGQGWLWCPSLGILEKEQFPTIKTFDSSRTPEEDDSAPEPVALEPLDIKELQAAIAEAAAQEEAVPKGGKGQVAPVVLAGIDPAEAAERERQAEAAGHGRGWQEGLDAGFDAAESALQGIEEAIARARVTLAEGKGALAKREAPPPPAAYQPPAVASRPAPVASAAPRDASRVVPAKQRLLDALAWLESIGRREADKTTLAFLADASATSSTFQNNLGSLRTEGMVDYPRGGVVALTGEGRRRANRPRTPLTTAELQSAIMAKLPPALQRIVTALVTAHPRALTKEALAEKVGASSSSSTFQNNLGRLRTMGLVDYPKPGQAQASATLFLERAAA